MKKFKQKTFKTVSDWIAAGHIASGYTLIENVRGETEKAIAVEIEKFNSAANLYTATVWLPKSLVQTVVNDYYLENMGAKVYIVPDWLMKKKGA
mgnify:CR=1 FL=1